MAFSCVTYNIQYGIGMDGRYDLERIIGEIKGADIIALQEVTRNNPQNGGNDMVAEIAALLPGYFHVFGAPYQVDMGSSAKDGVATSRYFEFGNMILSRTPIHAARNLLLPRTQRHGVLNLQRGALEAMITTPAGPVRFYSAHADHANAAERLMQMEWLRRSVTEYGLDGGAVSGVASLGFPEPPVPEHFLLMGDFNMVPESPEYVAICGPKEEEFGRHPNARFAFDVSMPEGEESVPYSWFDPKGEKPPKRLDYCLASMSLTPCMSGARVDVGATGSDHRPVWVTLE